MGNAESFEYQQVQKPATDLVATENRFLFNQPIVLILREKMFSFTGDDFAIKDVNNVSYFKCKGKMISFHDKKVIYDLYDKPILNIQHKIMSLKKNMKIYEGKDDKKKIATATTNSLVSFRKLVVQFFNKATEREEMLEIRCNLIAFNCGIFYGKAKEGAPLIAKISKKFGATSMFSSRDSYYVEVAPGVDAAFMIALAICFDEFRNDDDDD